MSPLGLRSHSSQLSKSPKAVRFEPNSDEENEADEEEEKKPQRTRVADKQSKKNANEQSASIVEVQVEETQPANNNSKERPRTQNQCLRQSKQFDRLVSMTSQNLVTVGYNADVSQNYDSNSLEMQSVEDPESAPTEIRPETR